MKLFIRGNKIWVTLSQNGKRIRKSTGLTDTKGNRKKVERDLLPLLEKTDFEQKKSVGYYFTKMMSGKTLKLWSEKNYDRLYTCYISEFNDLAITDIDVKFARDWTANLKVAPRTARCAVNVFNQIINEAVYDCVIDANPFAKVRLPKLIKHEPKPYSSEEVKSLLSAAEGWFRNFIAFMFLTGMRTGEVCALKWEDIKDGFIHISKSRFDDIVGTTKTGTNRRVPIFNDLLPFIEAQREYKDKSGFVFPQAYGARQMRAMWERVTKKCGLKGRVLYNARHTFATRALNSGKFNVSQIAKMLGHSSTQMLFQKYAKDIPSERDEFDLSFSAFGTI